MGSPRLPLQQGFGNGSSRPAKESAEIVEARISRAASLIDLSEEYRFYTPAILYLRVRLGDRDPLADFMTENDRDFRPVSFRFDRPLFAGLELRGDNSWNHVLFGLPPEDYEVFLPWLTSLTFVDRDRRHIARVRYRDLSIDDPLWRHKNPAAEGPPPQVTVAAFGIDASYGCFWLSRSGGGLPRMRSTREVYPDTAKFAKAVLGGSDNPLAESESPQDLEEELKRRWEAENGGDG